MSNRRTILPKRISRKEIYSSTLFDLFLDRIEFNSGEIVNDYHFLKFKNDSIVAIIKNEFNEICFIKSPRYTTQKIEWELPAGSIENGENVIEAGEREIREETGYLGEDLHEIYNFNPANGISDQKCHILVGKTKSNDYIGEFDKNEVLEVIWLSKTKVLKLIKNNEIKDGFALLALFLYFFSQEN